MKYKGKKLEGRNTDVLVIPRGSDKVVFKAEAIENYDEFDKLCPVPNPPEVLLPGGVKETNTKDKAYMQKIIERAEVKTDYTILKTLEPSVDLEWETVNIENPNTYKNWKVELKDSGFSEIEIMRVINLCSQVNCLDDNLLQQAKNDFLAEAQQPEQ